MVESITTSLRASLSAGRNHRPVRSEAFPDCLRSSNPDRLLLGQPAGTEPLAASEEAGLPALGPTRLRHRPGLGQRVAQAVRNARSSSGRTDQRCGLPLRVPCKTRCGAPSEGGRGYGRAGCRGLLTCTLTAPLPHLYVRVRIPSQQGSGRSPAVWAGAVEGDPIDGCGSVRDVSPWNRTSRDEGIRDTWGTFGAAERAPAYAWRGPRGVLHGRIFLQALRVPPPPSSSHEPGPSPDCGLFREAVGTSGGSLREQLLSILDVRDGPSGQAKVTEVHGSTVVAGQGAARWSLQAPRLHAGALRRPAPAHAVSHHRVAFDGSGCVGPVGQGASGRAAAHSGGRVHGDQHQATFACPP